MLSTVAGESILAVLDAPPQRGNTPDNTPLSCAYIIPLSQDSVASKKLLPRAVQASLPTLMPAENKASPLLADINTVAATIATPVRGTDLTAYTVVTPQTLGLFHTTLLDPAKKGLLVRTTGGDKIIKFNRVAAKNVGSFTMISGREAMEDMTSAEGGLVGVCSQHR